MDRLNIVIVYWNLFGTTRREGVKNHLVALQTCFPQHNYLYIDGYAGIPYWLENYHIDVMILHNTFLCLRNNYPLDMLCKMTTPLKKHPALKIAVPQDEYDMSTILDRWLEDIGIHHIFSNFPQYQEVLYPRASTYASIHLALTGYVTPSLTRAWKPTIKKQWQIGYRASHLPYWFGSLGQFKFEIGNRVKDYCEKHHIAHNIDTSEYGTLYGKKWYQFLQSCRGVLGCESGSSLLIKDEIVKKNISQFLQTHPDADFDTVARQCFPGEDYRYNFATISPRHLECAALRVCQVLLEGEYDGYLQPHVHYLPLKRDFSNLSDVLAQLNNDDLVNEITDNAYQDLIVSDKFSCRAFATHLMGVINTKQHQLSSKPTLEHAKWKNKSSEWKNKLFTKRFFHEFYGYIKQFFPNLARRLHAPLKRLVGS